MRPAEIPPIGPSLEKIRQPDFWREQCPALSINGRLETWDRHLDAPSSTTLEIWHARLSEEGYFQGRNSDCERLAPALTEAVITCKRLGLPPAFVFVFDEVWECFYGLHPMLSSMLGDTYRVQPEFWAWHVDPRAGEAGNVPHRDRGYQCLAADKSPNSLTVWVPLTEALPDNGCIYVLPANRDPVYGTEDEHKLQIDLTQIRALPAKPGDVLVWSQALLHWGAATSRFAPHPRISIGMDFQRGDLTNVEEPELLTAPFSNPGFDQRLRLIARQIIRYQQKEIPQFTRLAEQLLA